MSNFIVSEFYPFIPAFTYEFVFRRATKDKINLFFQGDQLTEFFMSSRMEVVNKCPDKKTIRITSPSEIDMPIHAVRSGFHTRLCPFKIFGIESTRH
jgi:hypothetical protein